MVSDFMWGLLTGLTSAAVIGFITGMLLHLFIRGN